MPDDVLLQEIRKGHETALEILYNKYRTKFVGVLINTKKCDEETAFELYQITIVIVYENIMSGKFTTMNNENSLWNYIFRTGINKYYDWKRKEMKTTGFSDGYFNNLAFEETDIEELIVEETCKLKDLTNMEKALAKMGHPCTTLLELFYYENKSMTEIAAELNYNNSNVAKNQKYKCLRKLYSILSKIKK